MIDILQEVYSNTISSDKGFDIIDEVVDKFHNNKLSNITIEKELNLDEYEWTAIAGHGIDLKVLAKWRYNGWPIACEFCGREFNYHNWYWIIKENKLKCLDCK